MQVRFTLVLVVHEWMQHTRQAGAPLLIHITQSPPLPAESWDQPCPQHPAGIPTKSTQIQGLREVRIWGMTQRPRGVQFCMFSLSAGQQRPWPHIIFLPGVEQSHRKMIHEKKLSSFCLQLNGKNLVEKILDMHMKGTQNQIYIFSFSDLHLLLLSLNLKKGRNLATKLLLSYK